MHPKKINDHTGGKEGRKEGRKERRKEGRKKGRKEGSKRFISQHFHMVALRL